MGVQEDRPDWLKDVGLLGVVASEVIGFSGAGLGIGWLLWKKLDWPWWVLILSALLGLTAAFYRIYRMTQLTRK